MNSKAVDGWNVAELAGGLLLSADDFSVQFSPIQVDQLLAILNSGAEGQVKDSKGDVIVVSSPDRSHVILKRLGDKVYPDGMILPVDAFSEAEDEEPVTEGLKPAFRRVGSKIKRGYRVTSGIRKGRVIANPATANKPRAKGLTRAKLRAAAKRNKLVRAIKSARTRKKNASLRLRRLNHTD